MCMDCGSRIAEMAGDGGRAGGVLRGEGEDDWRQIDDKGMGVQWGRTDNEEEERKGIERNTRRLDRENDHFP